MLGADMVMHSNTKFIGGHSDVLGGILITAKKDDFWEKLEMYRYLGGASPSAFDCYLLCRSIKTLSYRVKAHCENAMTVPISGAASLSGAGILPGFAHR
jgi:cystathionine gamma-synthase